LSKRVLITGASGFVGANLTRSVVEEGHDVSLLLRPGYQGWRLEEIADAVNLHQADLDDKEAVRSVVRSVRPDWVFHLAAYGAYSSQQDMDRMVRTNVLGCASLLDACAEIGVEAFINAGSSSEYGIKDHAPDEQEVLQPNSHYAITKAAATHSCAHASRTGALNAATVRLYSVFGPYEDPSRLIPSLIVHGLEGQLPPLVSPQVARDFIYVDDAVDAMLTIASSVFPAGAVYNVCSGVQTTIGEVVRIVKELMDVAAEPVWASMPDRAWDTDVWVGTGARLEHELGWRMKTSFADGLQKTIDWFRVHPKWVRFFVSRIGKI
jgi:UDP-glucose 4-epimerase